jgi:hypothetical protein
VIHNSGVEDQAIELAFQKRHPADIAQAVQRELNCVTANPPIILRGKWSDTVQKTGIYIFRLAGNLSAEVVHSYGPILCSIFPGKASVIPTRGWTWIQLRGVDVEYMVDDVGYTHDEEDLFKVFRANPCFANAVVPVPLYWQGNPLNFTKATATVITAILDDDNNICQRASREGVCMFRRQIKFVRAGDHPSLIQCTRCHELGHNASSPKCKTPRDQHRCYVCSKGHQSQHHSFECTGLHKVPGHCDCIPKCLLCKQSGHTAWDKGCPRRGDFALPRLPRAAPVEARPPVEDALKEAAIPHSHRARPVQGGGRIGKGKEKVVDTPLYPQENCSKNDDVPALLCFCCPMVQFVDYQDLYISKEFVSADAPKLVDGKDIIQLHSEFTIHKDKGEDFTREAQAKFPELFHSDAELADIINRAFLSIDRGSGHVGLSYLDETPRNDHWLENMGADPENVNLATVLKDADTLMEGWSVAKSAASLLTTPPCLPTPPAQTEYSWMLGGKRIPLGFAAQPLGPPHSKAGVEEPSETISNA